MKKVTFSLEALSNGFDVSIADSYADIFTTPKGSVIMLPEFGCDLNELIDKRMDDEWLIDFRRAIKDATIWETRKLLKDIEILKVDSVAGVVSFRLKFDDSSYLQGALNGF